MLKKPNKLKLPAKALVEVLDSIAIRFTSKVYDLPKNDKFWVIVENPETIGYKFIMTDCLLVVKLGNRFKHYENSRLSWTSPDWDRFSVLSNFYSSIASADKELEALTQIKHVMLKLSDPNYKPLTLSIKELQDGYAARMDKFFDKIGVKK